MVEKGKKPFPSPTQLDAPFWQAAKKGELRLQKCCCCGKVWYPPSFACPQCLSDDYKWVRMSGRGKIWSWVVFHQLYFQGFSNDIPYHVIVVQLEEGPLLTSSMTGVKNENIKCDMPVEVVFDAVSAEISLPRFQPANLEHDRIST